MRSRMLYALIVAAVLILAVALRVWAGEEPGNVIVHQQENEAPDEDDPDLMTAAA